MECGNRSIIQNGNRRRPHLGAALVLVCALSSVIAPLPAEAWGKKKKGKTATAAPTAQKISAVAAKLLQKARVLREKGKNEQAIETYKQALQIDSTLAEAYLELADIYSDINIPESSAAMLEAGLPLAEQLGYEPAALAAAWCQAAELNVRLGNLDLASGDLVKATTLAPDDALPHKIAGDIHTAKLRYDDAFKAYREAVRLDPQYGDAWFAMGTLALEAKRAKEAQAAYNGLLEADTDRAQQLAESMRQARLNPVVTPKQPLERTAAPTDDPYAVPGTPSGSHKPKAPVSPAPKPVAAAAQENPYEGVEPRPAAPALTPATKPPAATASLPPASASAVDTVVATISRLVASAPAPQQTAESVNKAETAPGAPATESTPLSDSLLQAMADRLFEDDPVLADKACEEMALYAEQAFPVVVKLLPDPDPERRIRLIRALGRMKKIENTVSPVLEELLLDPDPGVQAAAEDALKTLKQ